MEIKFAGPHGKTYVVLVNRMDVGKIDRMKKKPLRDSLVVPHWIVRCDRNKNVANMRQSSMSCKVAFGAGDLETEQRVNLPILQNTKALKKGEELVVFMEPQVPPSIPAQKLEQVTKKRPVAASRMQQAANKKKKR